MIIFSKWKDYDPAWLVQLAKDQYPDYKWLHESLEGCTKIKSGCYFVDPKKPNEPGSEWQFKESITLVHPEKEEVVLDILKDGRVGSIEFLGLRLKK